MLNTNWLIFEWSNAACHALWKKWWFPTSAGSWTLHFFWSIWDVKWYRCNGFIHRISLFYIFDVDKVNLCTTICWKKKMQFKCEHLRFKIIRIIIGCSFLRLCVYKFCSIGHLHSTPSYYSYSTFCRGLQPSSYCAQL